MNGSRQSSGAETSPAFEPSTREFTLIGSKEKPNLTPVWCSGLYTLYMNHHESTHGIMHEKALNN